MPGSSCLEREAGAQPSSVSAGLSDRSNPQQFCQRQQQLGQQPQQAVVKCRTQQQQYANEVSIVLSRPSML